MSIIKQIESNGNARAYNSRSGAIGLYQITPVCLKEYNNFNEPDYARADLYDPAINEKIARWYIEVRIPAMLRYYKKPTTTDNILICYNAGISYVVSGKQLPAETKNYILKNHRIERGQK